MDFDQAMIGSMQDANLTSADQIPDAITLPRAILFDLDDTILAAGQRLEVLRLIAREFEPELAPLQPDDVAERLDAVSFFSLTRARARVRLKKSKSISYRGGECAISKI